MVTDEQVRFFTDNGFLKLENVIEPNELAQLQTASLELIERGPASGSSPGERADFQYGRVRGTDRSVLRRIEYFYGKGDYFLRLLAHPVLMDAVRKIIGEQFVPTYDAMVIKMAGSGVEVPWHRDGDGYNKMYWDDPSSGHRFPAANFDFYLDAADQTTGGLWVVPGSNRMRDNESDVLRSQGGYCEVPGAMLVKMKPGDLLVHDVMLYHGSPETVNAPLRRVIYYEYRDKRFIDALHASEWPEDWIRRRLALVQRSIDLRRAAGMAVPFDEHPAPALRVSAEEAARCSARVAHPGWDEAAKERAA